MGAYFTDRRTSPNIRYIGQIASVSVEFSGENDSVIKIEVQGPCVSVVDKSSYLGQQRQYCGLILGPRNV